MLDKEFAQLTMAIKGFYPRVETFENPYVMEMWFESLKDLDFKVAINGIKAYAQTNKFPPTIADIREICASMTQPQQMGELEAWELVSKALKDSSRYAKENFEKLPPLIQKVIKQPATLREWAALDIAEVETVVASNFQRNYRAELQRESRVKQMSPDLQIAVNNQMRIGGK